MSRVVVKSDWGWEDQLDGTPLKNGETVTLRWPDGSVTDEVVDVKDVTKRVFTFHDEQYPDVRASVTVLHRGVPLRVELRDTEIDVMRRPQ